MATIDNLTLEISANNNSAVANIEKLATALSALKAASKGISSANLAKVATSLSELKYACAGISLSSIRRVERLADALERIAAIDAGNISNIVSAMNRIKNMPNGSAAKAAKEAAADTTAQMSSSLPVPSSYAWQSNFNNSSSATDGYTRVFRESIEMKADAYKEATTEMQSATEEFYGSWKEVTDDMNATGSAFNTATSRFQTFVNSVKQSTGFKKFAIDTLKEQVHKLGDAFKKVTQPIRNFFKALGRIALYRMIRGLLKAITQGLKEGIQNLAKYSAAMNELDAAQANKTMSELATSFLYLKNSIAAAVMPIIQQFTPAIQKLIEHCVAALNVINQLVSALQGKSTFTKAKVVWVDYAKTLDDTGKKAKALHHQLAGFDELNNLTAPTSSGSTELDPTTMFEEANIDNKLLKIVTTLKEKFDDILRIVGAIGVGILAWKISSGFASALTALGLLSKAGALQMTLGLTLMAAGFTLEGTSIIDIVKNGLNLDNFGTVIGGALLASLGSFLTGSAFQTIFGGTLLTGIIGGVGTIIAGLGLTFAGIWDSIVNGIDWLSAILTAIGTALTGAGIGTILGTIIGGLTGPLGAIVGAFVGLVVGLYVDYIIYAIQHWDEFKQAIVDTGEVIKSWFTEKIPNAVSAANEKFNEFVVKAIKWVEELFTEKIPYAVGFAIGKLVYWGTYAFAWVVAFLPKFVEKVKEFLTNCWEKFKEWGTNLMNFAVYEVPKIATKIIVGFTTLPFKIWAKLVEVKDKFIEWKDDMIKWVKEKIPEIKEGILYVFSGDFLDDVYNIGVDFIQNIWDGITSKAEWLFSNIADFFSKLFEKISKNFKQGFVEGGGTTPIPQYASGGYVPRGNLFIANERGPEMVGTINGNTAVANNNQITEAIAQAAYAAMSKALSENGGSTNIVIEGDGDRMFKVFQKKQREYQRTTGLAY